MTIEDHVEGYINSIIEEFKEVEFWQIKGFVDKPEGDFQECEGNAFPKVYIDQRQNGEDSYYGNQYIPIGDKFLKIEYSM